MVLESQMARAGGERRYMASRGRRRRKAPAVIAVLAVIGGACWFIVSAPGGNPAGQTNTDAGPNGPTASANVDHGSATHDENDNDRPPAAPDRRDPGLSQPSPDGGDRAGRPDGGGSGGGAVGTPTTSSRPPGRTTAGGNGVEPPDTSTDDEDQGTTSAVEFRKIAQARAMIEDDRLVEARGLLNQAMQRPLGRREARAVRQMLGMVNEELIFSAYVDENDPIADTYVLQPGDYLGKVAPRYDVPWRFIARINDIADVRRIRAGQRLKVIDGPFHAVVDKSAFRLDLYVEVGGEPLGMFVRSFEVGLGADDSTPLGRFIVKRGSKLTNPEWTNPRTGEVYYADDPANPIGERWIGLRGIDEATKSMRGYGIHGTIDPESIGREASMGCIRMKPDAVALVFDMLEQEESTITIKP